MKMKQNLSEQQAGASMTSVVDAAVRRIEQMEKLFDYVWMEYRTHTPSDLEPDAMCRSAVKQLSEYYFGGQWQEDYALDEQRCLPDDLKRGVLSQDGLYDLFCTLREQKIIQ